MHTAQMPGNPRMGFSFSPTQPMMLITQSPMMCCGIATLENFGAFSNHIPTFDKKAEFLAFLYKTVRIRNMLFIVTASQKSMAEFKLLVEIGAKQIDEWPNWNYGGKHNVYLYRVDIDGAVGKYLHIGGMPMISPEKWARYKEIKQLVADKKPVPVLYPVVGDKVTVYQPSNNPKFTSSTTNKGIILKYMGKTLTIKSIYIGGSSGYSVTSEITENYLPHDCMVYADYTAKEVAEALSYVEPMVTVAKVADSIPF